MRDRFRSEERRIEVLKTLIKKKAMAKAKKPVCKSCNK